MVALRGVDTLHGHDYVGPPRFRRRRVVCGIAIAIVAAGVGLQSAGCQRAKTATLTERASTYWQLKQQKRWEEVYDAYLDPAVKETLSKDAFLKKRLLAFDVVNFTITDEKEDGDHATVHVKMDANLPLRGIGGKVQMRRQEMTSDESWVRRDGTWYIHLSE